MNGPQLICCSCGRGHVRRMSPPLCLDCDPELEYRAAAMWKDDHPDMSVFDCTKKMKDLYVLYALYGKEAVESGRVSSPQRECDRPASPNDEEVV